MSRYAYAAHELVSNGALSLALRGSIDHSLVPGAPEPTPVDWVDMELVRRAGMKDAVALAEALEAAVERDIPGARVRVVANPPTFDTAGPGIGVPELLHFLLGDDPISRLAAYAELADRVPRVLRWLREHGGQIEEIGEDVAVAVAWAPALAETDAVAIDFVSVAPVQPRSGIWEGPDVLGWLVLFRTELDYLEVAVTRRGEPIGVVHRPLAFLEPPEAAVPTGTDDGIG